MKRKRKDPVNNRTGLSPEPSMPAFPGTTTHEADKEERREIGEKYKSLVDQIPVGIYRIAKDGKIIHANPALISLLEFDHVEDLLERHVTDIYHDKKQLLRLIKGWQKGESILNREINLITRKGRIVTVMNTGKAITDRKGDILYFDGVIEDISERRRTEILLERHLREQRLLLNVSHSVNAIMDLEKVLQTISDGAAQLINVESSAIYLVEEENLFLGATTPPLDPGMPSSLRRAALSDHPHIRKTIESRVPVVITDTRSAVLTPAESYVVELRHLRSIIYLPFQYKKQVIGVLILGTCSGSREFSDHEIDLCRTISNQLAIGIQNARLHTELTQYTSELELLNRISLICLEHSGTDMYTRVLKEALKVTGSRYGWFGYMNRESDLVIPCLKSGSWYKDKVAGKKAVLPLLEDGSPIVEMGIREKRPVISNNPLKSHGGKGFLKRALSVPVIFETEAVGNILLGDKPGDYGEEDVRNITSITTILAPILNAGILMEKKEEERSKLEVQLIQSRKLEGIGQLAGGIAHDINNVLTAIIGNTELALNGLKRGKNVQQYLEQVISTGKKGGELIAKILAFSRKQIIHTVPLDVNKTILNISGMLNRLISEDIQIDLKLAPALPLVKADPTQMEQILINLVVNARDAVRLKQGKEGKKLITIETSEVILDREFVSLNAGSSTGKHILISVKDNGSGIDSKILDRIFDPFFTTKESGEGTGLGLSTVYGIVKQNRGSIFINSEHKVGTTVMIYWPVLKRKSGSPDVIRKEIIKEGNETILFVEDNAEIKNTVELLLELYGYRVYSALNGREALELLEGKKIPIDILVTDVVMPEMGGLELSETLTGIYPDMKVLFCSGYLEEHNFVSEGLLRNVVNFLPKPYTIEDLIEKIREILDT